jgi:hypothetical protein
MPFGSAAKSPKTQKLEDLQDRVLKLNALMAAGIERENQHQLDEAEKKQANASLSRKLKDATDTLAIVTASLATVSAVVQEVSATALFHDSVQVHLAHKQQPPPGNLQEHMPRAIWWS